MKAAARSLFLAGSLLGASQFKTVSVTDTLILKPGDNSAILSRRLILQKSEVVVRNGSPISGYTLDGVQGRIEFADSAKAVDTLIISYTTLAAAIPTRFGPPLSRLPLLEDFALGSPKPQSMANPIREEPNALITSGVLSRGVAISPESGFSLNGGLRLSLQGEVAPNVFVTGTLSDQGSPIQPEGTTQSLDEIDRVFLQVTHPGISVTVGDVPLERRRSDSFQIRRQSEGIQASVSKEGTSVQSHIGTAKGRFHRAEFFGEDRNQGPYAISAPTGSRNLLIVAGSERVWLDGIELVRGENRDYVMDYSSGEITFTPRHLIDSRSRIYLEVQYSDLVFARSLTSVAVDRSFAGGRAAIEVDWIDERDRLSGAGGLGLTREEKSVLSDAGDAAGQMIRSTIRQDSAGSYLLAPAPDGDTVLVYAFGASEPGQIRYSAAFTNLGSGGSYARKVLADGTIYFEYVPESERNGRSDLFSPWKWITAPTTHQSGRIAVRSAPLDSLEISLETVVSDLDRNALSGISDGDNTGLAGGGYVTYRSHFGALGRIKLNYEGYVQENSYRPVERSRPVEFAREWNLGGGANLAEQLEGTLAVSEIGVEHEWGRFVKSRFRFGRLADSSGRSSLVAANSSGSWTWMPEFQMDYLESSRDSDSGSGDRDLVTGNSSLFRRHLLSVTLLPTRLRPFFKVEGDERSSDRRRESESAGLRWFSPSLKGAVSLTRRRDAEKAEAGHVWEEQAVNWIGEGEFSGSLDSGWRFNILGQRKVQKVFDSSGDTKYAIARASVSRLSSGAVPELHWNLRLEEGLFEPRIAFYDSIGPGRGQYRYDPAYQQYFPDPLGTHIVTHIPSGERTRSTSLESSGRAQWDLSFTRVPWLKDSRLRVDASQSADGDNLTPGLVFSPGLGDAPLHAARLQWRFEWDRRIPARRWRWKLNHAERESVSRRIIGEPVEERNSESGVLVEWPVTVGILGTGGAEFGRSRVISPAPGRSRNHSSGTATSGLRASLSGQWDIGGDLILGVASGRHEEKSFVAKRFSAGLLLAYKPRGGGRLQTKLEASRVKASWGDELLPPEALDGHQPGTALRLSTSGTVRISENLSASTTFSYLDDAIHDRNFHFAGELHASF